VLRSMAWGISFCPSTFEPLARHYTVLDSEEPQQERIDYQGLEGKNSSARINRFGNNKVPDKADGVKKCEKENQVCDEPI